MCTSLSIHRPYVLYGRNLDLEYAFGEQVAFTPRRFLFPMKQEPAVASHYAMIGMASEADSVPLYAEAVNEKGLYMAGLNFPGNAYYFPKSRENCRNVAPYELIPWVLGQCETLAQARALLQKTQLIAIPFARNYPLAPLHFHLAGPDGSLVIEPMQDGLHLYENPIGVLTNNPPFPYQLANLNNYQHLSPRQAENRFAASLPLAPYGQGMGAIGLPGDASPASRFVKAAFLAQNADFGPDKLSAVTEFFHILDGVSMVRGSVVTEQGKLDMTTYSCCIDPEEGVYYYKTYENNQLNAVSMQRENLDAAEPVFYPLRTRQSVFPVN